MAAPIGSRLVEVRVDGGGSVSALTDGPDDQALATAAVPGSKDAGHGGGEGAEVGGEVGAGVCGDVELGREDGLGAQETCGVPKERRDD